SARSPSSRALRRRRSPISPATASASARLLFEQDRQVVDVVIGAVPIGHERANLTAAIDQIGERGMRIGVRVADALLFGADAVVLAHGGELRGRAGAADESAIEAGEILLHSLDDVALGVNGDVDDLHVRRGSAEIAARLRERAERGRAHVRARGEPEAEHHHLAAVLTQLEITTVGPFSEKSGAARGGSKT